MSTTFKTGWLLNDDGEKFAPKTLLSQISTNDGVLLERKIETDLLDIKTKLDTDIAVERARIDAFTALPEGSTTGDAALEDIKIKVDGTPADTAGNAVREQINTLDDKIDEEVGKLSSEIEEIVNKSNYENMLVPIFDTVISMPESGTSPKISNVVDLEANTKYYGYAKVTISNLQNFVQGAIYLKFLHTLAIDCTEKVIGIDGVSVANGTFELYGEFTTTNSGQVKALLVTKNIGSYPFTFDFTVEKLYLFKDTNSDEVLNLIQSKPYSDALEVFEIENGLVKTNSIENKSITYEKLSDELKGSISKLNTTIIDCYGDSLTQGAGSTNYPYPTKLQELVGSNYTVNNYGQGGEKAEEIAFRQGGLNAIVKPFEMVEGKTYIDFKSINGADISNVSYYTGKYYGNSNVYINGEKLMFRASADGAYLSPTNGNQVGMVFDRPYQMIAEGNGTNHILLVCIGQNGWVDDNAEHLADVIDLMIEHNNYAKYLVIGRPTGTTTDRAEEEKILSSRFGNHYVNAREYISAYAIADNNLTATSGDESAMSIGAIPPQVRNDSVHMNDYGYISMAYCIYQHGKELGYWS